MTRVPADRDGSKYDAAKLAPNPDSASRRIRTIIYIHGILRRIGIMPDLTNMEISKIKIRSELCRALIHWKKLQKA